MAKLKLTVDKKSKHSSNKEIMATICILLVLSLTFTGLVLGIIKVLKDFSSININWTKNIDYRVVQGKTGVLYSTTLCILLLVHIFVKYNIIGNKLRIITGLVATYLHILSVVSLTLEYIDLGESINIMIKIFNYLGALFLPFYFFVILKAIDGINESLGNEKLKAKHFIELSYIDNLTGLPNRGYITIAIKNLIDAENTSKNFFGILFMDLDGFKKVNDTFGHDIGDNVLVEISKRLLKTIRPVDVASRLGGDEFVVLIPDIKDLTILENISIRIIKEINKKIDLNGLEVYVGISIGISIYPKDGTNVEALLKYADTALYEIKKKGKNSYKFY